MTIENEMRSQTLYGWIAVSGLEDRSMLESFGITLGPLHQNTYENCIVPGTAFEKLSVMWGFFVWGLTPEPSPELLRAANRSTPA